MNIFSPFSQFKYRRNGLKVNGSRHPDCWFMICFGSFTKSMLYEERRMRHQSTSTYALGDAGNWEKSTAVSENREWWQRPRQCFHCDLRSHPLPLLLHLLRGWLVKSKKEFIWGLRKIHDKFCLKSEFIWRKDEARGSRWRWGHCWYKGGQWCQSGLGIGKHGSAA